MCDDGTGSFESSDADPALDPVLNGHSHHPTRRSVLAAGALGLVGAATGAFAGASSALAATPASPLSSSPLVRAAMHVHASCSEGAASWETQFAQAASLVDVLYLTDHDFRALAYNYLSSLNGVALTATSTGAFAQKVTTNTNGVVRTAAESSSATAAAAVTYAIPERPTAWNQLRTYIAGHSLVVTFPSARIDAGGTYELVVQLSNHPAFGSRPAGQFFLRYRFGAFATGRFVDATGLTGVVTHATPAAGSKVTLDIPGDVAALWPDMLAADNSFAMLSMVATSPRKGSVVDVSMSVQFVRTKNDSASLIAAQKQVLATYGPRYPRLTAYASVEISRLEPHTIPFGVPQFWPDQTTITNANHDAAYNAIAASVRAQGGLVSWNHPFGFSAGPLLSATEQVTKRRAVFASMIADNRLRHRHHRGRLHGPGPVEHPDPHRPVGHVLPAGDLHDRQRRERRPRGRALEHAQQRLHHRAVGRLGVAAGPGRRAGERTRVHLPRWSVRRGTAGPAGRRQGGHGQGVGRLADQSIGRDLRRRAAQGQLRRRRAGAGRLHGQRSRDQGRREPASHVVHRVGNGVAGRRHARPPASYVSRYATSAGSVVGIGNPVWLLRAPPPKGIPAARAA